MFREQGHGLQQPAALGNDLQLDHRAQGRGQFVERDPVVRVWDRKAEQRADGLALHLRHMPVGVVAGRLRQIADALAAHLEAGLPGRGQRAPEPGADPARGGVEQQGQVGTVGALAHPECGCVGHGDILLCNRHSGLKGHNRHPCQHRTRP